MQRYFTDKLIDNNFILNKDDMYHIKTVMRLKEKDQIEVVYKGVVYISELIQDEIVPIEKIIENTQTKQETTIIIPLLKEQKLDYIIQKSTELGVNNIIVTKMNRCVVKVKDNLDKKIVRWTKIAKEASEQSKRIEIPNVTFEEDIEEIEGIGILANPKSNQSIKNYLSLNTDYDKINILIGPEGGLTEKEIQKYKKIGFCDINIGTNILRTETAPIAILSMINYEKME